MFFYVLSWPNTIACGWLEDDIWWWYFFHVWIMVPWNLILTFFWNQNWRMNTQDRYVNTASIFDRQNWKKQIANWLEMNYHEKFWTYINLCNENLNILHVKTVSIPNQWPIFLHFRYNTAAVNRLYRIENEALRIWNQTPKIPLI